jgi:hypothetical protein
MDTGRLPHASELLGGYRGSTRPKRAKLVNTGNGFENFWVDGNSYVHFTQFSTQISPSPQAGMGSIEFES